MEVFAIRYIETGDFVGRKKYSYGPSNSPKFYSRQSSATQLARSIIRRVNYVLSEWDNVESLSNGCRYIRGRFYLEKPERPNLEIVAFELRELGKIIVEAK